MAERQRRPQVSGWRTMPIPAELQRRIDAARGRFDRRVLPKAMKRFDDRPRPRTCE
jgi:hypothetical protein